jgi:branched-chain amino acid transport system ATP-binding protein
LAERLLAARRLTRRFGGLVAVADVSLDLVQGEVHAVIGTNGAGKSTLVNLLSGELRPASGAVELLGRDVSRLSQPRRALAGLGRSYQRSTIFPELTVLESCRLAAQARLQRPWAIWNAAHRCATSTARARRAIERAGLEPEAGVIAGHLPHGKKRQLEIALCLATEPRVLLLDEPLSGMGAEETERMLALLTDLKADHATLLVEHDMDAVFRVADRITVMVDGAAIASDIPERVRANAEVQRAYLGHGH